MMSPMRGFIAPSRVYVVLASTYGCVGSEIQVRDQRARCSSVILEAASLSG